MRTTNYVSLNRIDECIISKPHSVSVSISLRPRSLFVKFEREREREREREKREKARTATYPPRAPLVVGCGAITDTKNN